MERIRVSLEDLRDVAIAAGVKDEYINSDVTYVGMYYQDDIKEYSYSLERTDYNTDDEHAVIRLLSFAVVDGQIVDISVGQHGNIVEALHKMKELGIIK